VKGVENRLLSARLVERVEIARLTIIFKKTAYVEEAERLSTTVFTPTRIVFSTLISDPIFRVPTMLSNRGAEG